METEYMNFQRQNQVKLYKPRNFFSPVEEVVENPAQFFEDLSSSGKKFFLYLWNFASWGMKIRCGQEYWARRFDLSSRQIRRIYAFFVEKRIIHRTRRFNKTNITYFSGFFLQTPIMEKLRNAVRGFQSCLRNNVLITNIKDIYLNSKRVPDDIELLRREYTGDGQNAEISRLSSGDPKREQRINPQREENSSIQEKGMEDDFKKIRDLLMVKLQLSLAEEAIIKLSTYPFSKLQSAVWKTAQKKEAINNKYAYILAICDKKQHNLLKREKVQIETKKETVAEKTRSPQGMPQVYTFDTMPKLSHNEIKSIGETMEFHAIPEWLKGFRDRAQENLKERVNE